jgi:hypothetical protein
MKKRRFPPAVTILIASCSESSRSPCTASRARDGGEAGMSTDTTHCPLTTEKTNDNNG